MKARDRAIEILRNERELLWNSMDLFVKLRDSHGAHDMSFEIRAIEMAITKLREVSK